MSSSHRPGLASLVHPMDARRFLDEHWPDRPYCTHGPLDRLGSLARAPQLRSFAAMLKAERRSIRAWMRDSEGRHRTAVVTANQAEHFYATGAVTISIDSVAVPAVRRMGERLRRELGPSVRAVSCNAYVSPGGRGTTALHFDDHEVFAIQLRGRKRWSFAPNLHVPSPLVDYAVGMEVKPELRALCRRLPETLPEDAATAVLEPGSVLFLPRGYWHLTDTLEPSVHLTLAVAGTSWADLVVGRIRERLVRDEEWRRTATGLTGSRAARTRARRHLTSLLTPLSRELETLLDVDRLTAQYGGRDGNEASHV